MSENIELSYVWDHTIMKILNHDIHSKIGNMIKEWVVFNKLEDSNSLLEYTDDDFTSTGKPCYMNENGEKLYRKLMKQFFNLRWYIQHLVDEYEYQYGDNEWTNPLHESNWTYRTNKQFMKYVNFTLKEMTPEQMKINPIKPIIKVNTNRELDTEEGESNSDEQESTISNEEQEEFTTSEELAEDEYSTFSDMSRQDSESDINVDETQHQENSHTPETLQIHNTYNTTIHDKHNLIHNEYDTSENEHIDEIETIEHYGRKFMKQKSPYVQKHLKFLLYSTKQYIMKMIHQMTNLRLKLVHQKRMGSKKLEKRSTFHISYKESTYQIFMDTCNEKYKRKYQLVRRQET